MKKIDPNNQQMTQNTNTQTLQRSNQKTTGTTKTKYYKD